MAQHLAELYRHRALVWALVGRELKGRYRGSVLGFLWTFLNPLMMLAVYALVFKFYFKIQMDNYSVFMFTGLLPWVFFSQSLIGGAGAITSSGALVTKVAFPQQVLPLVQVAANFINYLLSLPILIAFLLIWGVPLTPALAAFPVVAVVHILFTYACVLLLATANVYLRDTQHIMSNLMNLWFFLTPIFYPMWFLGNVPSLLALPVRFNPATHFTLAYHRIFFHGQWPLWGHLALMCGLSLVLLALAVAVFEGRKACFAERI
jgi:lipopolysaccharide transport system permease protein